ncbi:hypothetical protein QVD17_36106 [Tagetes erecta]|uniref:ADP-ribosyl cyclase/cyclic ADP-ribose hydrolase n=1 Tax=Tagetes erecta TaxID=13708 RepID=A0AAD8NH33_TARER|nr:hypothetical protein QVD17_36106 [Tagetes erecta]
MDGALVASSSSSTTKPARRWTYDVFLSFRGEDTRNSFVDHLYAALDQAGIYTFKDDKELLRGKSITPELVKAIQESMVAVIIFSKNYANSSWCLDELAKIIECRNLLGQRVLPVFYDVDPSDVRKLKRSFLEAFQQHEVNLIHEMEKVERWREALVTASGLSGWDVPRTASGLVLLAPLIRYVRLSEAECIKQIVSNILKHTMSCPTEILIGIESRVRHVKSLLGKRPDDFCIIGIWGMGGIGKTTIARAVYRQISCEFEGSCFLEDVRENGCDKRGLKSLQEKFLSEILMQEQFKVKDCDDGMCQIRRRMSRKKVLVVLDDVDNIKQLQFLAGSHEWFGLGSRVMITTRDEHVLCYTQEKYVPELLTETEAMKLFSRYAFKADVPPKEYEKLSGVVVSQTGHLPLALKILGSHFCGRNLDFWQSGLKVLAKIPHKEINEILKLSFDGLNKFEQKIFLYIACFFKGKKRHNITRVLDSFDLEPVSGITVLIEKSLLTTSNGSLHMHDLIQEMGRCIVRECKPNNMLWCPNEIKEVMTTIDRLKTVEAIVETQDDEFCYSAIGFKIMKKLTLLQVGGRFTSSEPMHLPEQLKWLRWIFYPYKYLTITTDMSKLVGLEMMYSWVDELQIEKKVILRNLKFMNLSHSHSIKSFPDVSTVPNLERLNLSHCRMLEKIHQSVLFHEKIIHLDLSFCDGLKSFPDFINMKSLQSLHLNSCSHLPFFPDVTGEMGRLLVLNMNDCDKITKLPWSFRLFTGLTILSMKIKTRSRSCAYGKLGGPLIKVCQLSSSLRIMNFRNDELFQSDIPTNMHNVWPFLEELDLSGSTFTCLPASIFRFSSLKYLNLSDCTSLIEIPELSSVIQVLRADHCLSLKKIEDFSVKYKWLFKISLYDCPGLLMDHESQSHIASFLKQSLVQTCAAVMHRLSITVPGSRIPDWFTNQRLGNSITIKLPQSHITKMTGLVLCCHFLPPSNASVTFLKIKFKLSDGKDFTGRVAARAAKKGDVVWTGYLSIDILGNV